MYIFMYNVGSDGRLTSMWITEFASLCRATTEFGNIRANLK